MSHNQNPESEWPTQNHENSYEGGRYPGFDSGPNGGWHIIPCFAPAPARPNPEAPASSSCSCACAAVCVMVCFDCTSVEVGLVPRVGEKE